MMILRDTLSWKELRQLAAQRFGDYVKAVVDTERMIMALDSDLHSDEERALLEDGSDQYNLWGINIYPDQSGDDFVEFDSMINVRPVQNNRSRDVEDPDVRARILEVVKQLIRP